MAPIQYANVLFDFFNTLVIVDEDRPPMWRSLCDLGYWCDAKTEFVFNSEGFNGQSTPAGPAYSKWRRRNIIALCSFVGVPEPQQETVADYLLLIDSEWTVRPVEGALQTLDKLIELGVPVGIVSNWDYDLADYCRQAALPAIPSLTSAQIGIRKPNPRILIQACERFGFSPTETIYVGDSWECDVVAAAQAGIQACWLTASTEPVPPSVLTVGTLTELLGLIDPASAAHVPGLPSRGSNGR